MRVNKLVKEFGFIQKVYEAKRDELLSVDGIGMVIGSRIFVYKSLDKAREIKRYCDSKKYKNSMQGI